MVRFMGVAGIIAVLVGVGYYFVRTRDSTQKINPDSGKSPHSPVTTRTFDPQSTNKSEVPPKSGKLPWEENDLVPVPPGFQTSGEKKSVTRANRKVAAMTVEGPNGKKIQVPVPPQRIPSTTGPPTEAMALEKIRRAMPDAYMVKEVDRPPKGGPSDKPPSR